MPKTPEFKSEQEEAEFWDTHDATDYLDETTPVELNFVDTRTRKTLISLRMDPEVISRMKTLAARKGMGYQTLMRMWVMQQLEEEEASERRHSTHASLVGQSSEPV